MLTTGNEGAAGILLIEDNDGDVFLLAMALQKAGFRHTLTTIRDGADAIDFLKNLAQSGHVPPDLILLDLNLPRVDGGTIVHVLRSQPDLQPIPVVILSSSQSPDDAARVANIARSMFIVKPSNLEAFMEIGHRVRDFLQSTRHEGSVAGA